MTASVREQRYETLIELGIALSAEHDHNRLMEMILEGAKSIANADGGSLYLTTTAGDGLRFEIMLNDSLAIRMGGTSGKPIPFAPLRLYGEDGQPNHKHVASHCALTGVTVNIDDAYDAEKFDFTGTKAFDANTGYRSKSFLTVPLRNYQREVVGVLQLINAQSAAGEVIVFSEEVTPLIESLASQAAIARAFSCCRSMRRVRVFMPRMVSQLSWGPSTAPAPFWWK